MDRSLVKLPKVREETASGRKRVSLGADWSSVESGESQNGWSSKGR